jgi:hypothetical protein
MLRSRVLLQRMSAMRSSVMPSVIMPIRQYGGPARGALSVQEIEDRVLELLRNFSKVNKDKVISIPFNY